VTSEKLFENRVKKFLDDTGCWHIKYWAGAAYTKTGIPDLLICCNGYFVAVEVKSERGKPSELQLWTIEQIKSAGGRAFVLYPNGFEDFKTLIRELKDR
jgi:Holliday junction resolvase